MITKLFSVYDLKACVYGVPFATVTSGSAVRMFQDLVNDKNSSVSKHPTDYVLFEIGTFDDQKGSVMPLAPQVSLGLASDYLEPVSAPGPIQMDLTKER